MSALELDYRQLLRLLLRLGLSILAITVVLAATHRAVWAEGHTFILPASSGYGVSDCLGKPQGCSEVVASAWCEAHGYAAPIAYGKAEDAVTAKIAVSDPALTAAASPAALPAKIDPEAFVVTCGE